MQSGKISKVEANLDMVGSPNFARFVYDGDQMSNAAAHATWTLARSTSPVTSEAAAKRLAKRMKRGKALTHRGGQVIR